uniref:Uncharacterized protein n=1 Tax=Rhizophagus irregularis (strain DAOM 181602 / DAOM 197198 / MUCL 43194) TaxID=747089 RepID=U9TR15_RHIID
MQSRVDVKIVKKALFYCKVRLIVRKIKLINLVGTYVFARCNNMTINDNRLLCVNI